MRDAVQGWVEKECLPIIAGHYEKGTFPHHLIPRMAEMGLFGPTRGIDGCKEGSHMAYGLVCQALGRCDSGLRAMFSAQNSLVMYPVFAFGSEDQRESGSRKWHGGRSSGVRLSEARMPGQTPRDADPGREKWFPATCFTGKKRCGSPMGPWPTWPSFGPSWMGRSRDSGRNGPTGLLPSCRAGHRAERLAYRTSPTAMIFLDGREILGRVWRCPVPMGSTRLLSAQPGSVRGGLRGTGSALAATRRRSPLP